MTTDVSPLTMEMVGVLAALGPEEERRAIATALKVCGPGSENLLVRGAELAVDKPRKRGERPLRQVRVLLSAPAESVVREVVVDGDGRVVADRELGPRNLPYLAAEVEQARAVAERDKEVARRLAGYQVGVGTFAPMLGTAGRHRLVGLHFLDVADPNVPRPLTSVVVDLATGQVVHDAHGHESREEA